MTNTSKGKGVFILITVWKGVTCRLLWTLDLHLTKNKNYFINLSERNSNILYDLSWCPAGTFRGYRNGILQWNGFKMLLNGFSYFYTDWIQSAK